MNSSSLLNIHTILNKFYQQRNNITVKINSLVVNVPIK